MLIVDSNPDLFLFFFSPILTTGAFDIKTLMSGDCGAREDMKLYMHFHQITTGQHELYELRVYHLDKWHHPQEAMLLR